MRDKILMLIIGILIGAILISGGFLLLGRNNNKDKVDMRNFDTNMVNGGDRKGGPGRRDLNSTTKDNQTNQNIPDKQVTNNTIENKAGDA